MRLPDGRVFAWSEWGSASCVPVVFCTGAGMSGYLGFGCDDVGPMGLRLIAFDRPGLGASDPHPSKTLSTWVEDVAEFLRTESIQGALGVGFSQGAAFVAALAGSGLLKAMAIVSGQDQLDHPALAPLLKPEVAQMVESANEYPEEYERNLESWASADVLRSLILQMSSETDVRIYLSEPMASAYRRCLDEGFAQGAQGYARDLVNSLRSWPVQPEQIAIPVDLWMGGRDSSPVHSPDQGATLAKRFPRCDRHVEQDEGSSILWTRSRAILEALILKAGC